MASKQLNSKFRIIFINIWMGWCFIDINIDLKKLTVLKAFINVYAHKNLCLNVCSD